MSFVINKKQILKNKEISGVILINGYHLPSRNHNFIIEDEIITNINITNKKLAHKFVFRAANKKYNKLLNYLTELFINDDDGDSSMSEVLNQIEKFREEVKRKYRKYLKQKELEEMATKLKFLQNEAKTKKLELYYQIKEEKSNYHSR